MNERILELVEQAKAHVLVRIDEDDSDWDDQHTVLYNQKFAELIVRECMELALAEQKRYANITHRNMSECAVALGNFSLLMKDHFEDEE